MLRSLQIWVPALGLIGAIGIATIALSLDDPSPPGPPTSAVSRPLDLAAQPAAILDTTEATPAPPKPAGILTYLTGDGSYVAIDAADPSSRFDVTEAATAADSDAKADGIYPSPDGRYVASVRRDETGTWLDVHEGARLVISRSVAGPDDPELVAATKGLAAAVDGVPLRIAWSPDARYLAFGSITGAPYSLAVTRTDLWATLYREVAGGYVGELAWAPDSSQLAVSTYELDRSNHTVLLYDTAGTSVRHLIDGCTIVWAPDATFLAVHREPSIATGVWITSPDGETRIEATGDKSAFPVAWVRRDS